MKTGLLCSHPFAFPSIELLSSTGSLAGLGCPVKGDFTSQLKAVSNQLFVPLKIFENGHEDSIKEWLDMTMPDVVFVMGFPFRFPEEVLSIPPLGFYNFHTGLLPKYRGIDPVFWQIRNREHSGGITVHQVDRGFDTGPVIHVEKLEIQNHDTYGSHMQKLSFTAGECTIKMVDKLSSKEEISVLEQEDCKAEYLKRPDMNDLLIDWNRQSSGSIKALVQAGNPVYGGAVTFCKGSLLRMIQMSVCHEPVSSGMKPGTVISIENGLKTACSDQIALNIDILFSDAGLFTGERFTESFQINEGDLFTNEQFSNVSGQ